MRVVFLIGAVFWAVYLYLTSSYASMELSLYNFLDVELIFQFTIISWVIGIFSFILSILGFVKVRGKGAVLLGIFSVLATLLVGFLGTTVLYMVGSQVHEVAPVLYGLAGLQILICLILAAMAKSKS